MRRRDFLYSTGSLAFLASNGCSAASSVDGKTSVIWKPVVVAEKGLPVLEGFTDCVPDIVGRLGSPIDLAIFTEGNQFPALLGGEILQPFRAWAAKDSRYSQLSLENIVVVTLPQPIIVSMIETGGIVMGNLTLSVDRKSGFYPDVVMAGQAPLQALRRSQVVEEQARVFAKSRGLVLLVRSGNPLGVSGLDDLTRPGIRLVLATTKEPGIRARYLATLDALMGQEKLSLARQREIVEFPGRLGIQHRDVLQALSTGVADIGILVRHLAQYFATTYPDLCEIVPVAGADNFPATIALAIAQQPPRETATRAFYEYFFGRAREVYPKYGFAEMSSAEYGAALMLG